MCTQTEWVPAKVTRVHPDKRFDVHIILVNRCVALYAYIAICICMYVCMQVFVYVCNHACILTRDLTCTSFW